MKKDPDGYRRAGAVFALRLPPEARATIQRAANLALPPWMVDTGHMASLGAFIVEAALAEAQRRLTNRSAPAPEPEEPAGEPLDRGTVITPQRPEGEPVLYRVIAADRLWPSHDPMTFQPAKGYPPDVQEREYHRQTEEQVKVISGAQKLNPALLLTDTPSAVDGPPITASWHHDGPPLVVLPDGPGEALVLGGNGRAMMIKRAFRNLNVREKYRRALLRKAPAFGLDRAEIKKMRAPVLVRVVPRLTWDSPRPELVAAVRRFNEGLTQALSARARAVAEARTVSPEALAAIGELLDAAGPEVTLREATRTYGLELAAILRRDGIITRQNQSELLGAGGKFSDAGRDRVEGIFLGRVVGTGDRMAQAAPAILAKLERAVPPLLRVASLNPAADEIPTVQAALDVLADAARRGMELGDLARQVSFTDAPPDPAAVELARILDAEGQVQIADRFRRWAALSAVDPRQGSLLGAAASPADTRAELLKDAPAVPRRRRKAAP
jgi:hypothetical protein